MSFQLKYGVVSDIKKGFVKVHFEENEIVSDWLPVLVHKSKTDKESWQLEVKEHVVCLMDAKCNEGVCIGAIPNDEDTPDPGEGAGKYRKIFSDGTEIEYDKAAHKLTVDVKGSIEVKAEIKATVQAPDIEAEATATAKVKAPVITLEGNVVVTGSLTAAAITTSGGGNISAQGNINVQGNVVAVGEVTANGKNLSTHIHGGVQPGAGITGLPQ